ncbi:MAG: DMT family transporter [Chitinophagaceae bacterium]|nr:DMT family transporter [Chitinophagaceae bacterium]
MSHKFINWFLFVILCFIWGSSFELMKLGMFENHDLSKPVLSPYQVATIRILCAGLVMLPFAYKAIKTLPKNVLLYIILSGLIGSFIPAFLFCIAETKIGGGIAGSLNSLTPLFVIVVGAVFFNLVTTTRKIVGVVIGLAGSVFLIYANAQDQHVNNYLYISFVILATVLYGFNVNMVVKKLTGVPSIQIAAIAFSFLIIPAIIILYYTGYFSLNLLESKYILATSASSALGILATAIASILFYSLMKRAGGLFASTVTYGIPFVAIGWGLLNGEHITILHVIGLIIILCGVYLANKN